MLEFVKQDTERVNSLRFDSAFGQRFHAWVNECNDFSAAGDPTGRGDPTVLIIESGVGLTEIYHRLGWEFFTTLMMDYADLLEAYLDARNQAELRRVAAIADPHILPIALTYDDIAYKTATLISPKWLRKYWVPRLKSLIDAWHARGTLCLYHSDGNLWNILDDLVGAGIDGLNPLEVLAGMTVKEVRQKYPQLFLTGGIDVSQLLCLGTAEEVREVCRQTIRDADGKGYFIGSSTELHWGVKLENAVAMFETAWGGETFKG
jgi:uroporphyrinogen decarboxylase